VESFVGFLVVGVGDVGFTAANESNIKRCFLHSPERRKLEITRTNKNAYFFELFISLGLTWGTDFGLKDFWRFTE